MRISLYIIWDLTLKLIPVFRVAKCFSCVVQQNVENDNNSNNKNNNNNSVVTKITITNKPIPITIVIIIIMITTIIITTIIIITITITTIIIIIAIIMIINDKLVEHCTGIAEVTGSIPLKPEFFSGFSFAIA